MKWQQKVKKRALVTGDTGFLGSYLSTELKQMGYDVIGFSKKNGRDICKSSNFVDLPKIDYIFHLAAETNSNESWANPDKFIQTNIIGTTHVLDCARKHNSTLITISSYPYGNTKHIPTPEDTPLLAENPYTVSKIAAEKLCQLYATQYNLAITSLRCFNIYGPNQPTHFIIPQMIHELNRNNTITLTHPTMRRDFVYVTDVVAAFIAASIRKSKKFKAYNVGSGTEISMQHLAQMLIAVSGKKNAKIVHKKTVNPLEVPRTCADIRLAQKELKWKPQINLSPGLQMIYDGSL